MDDCVARLLNGYLHGFHTISLTDGTDIGSRRAQTNCLNGIFVARSILLSRIDPNRSKEVEAVLEQVNLNLLTAMFSPSSNSQLNLLTPIFQQPRELLETLRTTARPMVSCSCKARMISLSPTINLLSHDAIAALDALKVFVDGLAMVEYLAGPVVARNKAQKEGNRRRPIRLALEARVLAADLGMSMASTDFGAVKARSVNRRVDVKQEVREKDFNNGEVTGDGRGFEMVLGSELDARFAQDDIRWEDIAEKSLVECLKVAKELVEAGRLSVLTEDITRSDWLEEEGTDHSDHRSSTSSSSMADGTDTDSDQDSFLDSASSDTGGEAHSCPLRTTFRLQDRYEELRLAIWLSIPPASRGGMGTFIRGDDGRVGEIWDELGLALLKVYDRSILLS